MFMREAKEARARHLVDEQARAEREFVAALLDAEKATGEIDAAQCRAAYLEAYARTGRFEWALGACVSPKIDSIKPPVSCRCEDENCPRCKSYHRLKTTFEKRNPHYTLVSDVVWLRSSFFQ